MDKTRQTKKLRLSDQEEYLQNLRKKLLSADWKTCLKGSDAVAKIGGKKAQGILIPLLRSKKVYTRRAAALALGEIRDSRAVKPLLDSIFKNKGNNAVMVFALESLDCRRHLLPILKIALHHEYLAKVHALSILKKQKFLASSKDIHRAYRLIEDFKMKSKPKYHQELITRLQRYLRRVERHKKRDRHQLMSSC